MKEGEVLEVGIFSFCFPLFLFHATPNIWVLGRSKWLANCMLHTLRLTLHTQSSLQVDHWIKEVKVLINLMLQINEQLQFSNIFMAPPLDKPHVGLAVVLSPCAFHYWVDSNLMFYVLSNFSLPPCAIPYQLNLGSLDFSSNF